MRVGGRDFPRNHRPRTNSGVHRVNNRVSVRWRVEPSTGRKFPLLGKPRRILPFRLRATVGQHPKALGSAAEPIEWNEEEEQQSWSWFWL